MKRLKIFWKSLNITSFVLRSYIDIKLYEISHFPSTATILLINNSNKNNNWKVSNVQVQFSFCILSQSKQGTSCTSTQNMSVVVSRDIALKSFVFLDIMSCSLLIIYPMRTMHHQICEDMSSWLFAFIFWGWSWYQWCTCRNQSRWCSLSVLCSSGYNWYRCQ